MDPGCQIRIESKCVEVRTTQWDNPSVPHQRPQGTRHITLSFAVLIWQGKICAVENICVHAATNHLAIADEIAIAWSHGERRRFP
jgi:hypothetical protein